MALIAHEEVVRVGPAEWWAEFKIFKDPDGSYCWQLQAASGRIIARSGHAYQSKYWCEQDVNWLRANADQVMVYDHTRTAPASGSQRSSTPPRAVTDAASRSSA